MSRKVKTYRLARLVTADGLYTVTNAALTSLTLTKTADGLDVGFKTADGSQHRKLCCWMQSVENKETFLIPEELLDECGEIEIPV
jgi:hypothetical protein